MKMQKINSCNKSNSKSSVILILVLIVCWQKPISCLTALNGLPDFVEKCEQRCEDQNRTHSDLMALEDETLCKNECRIKQCGIGCKNWENALDASCQKVCNKTEMNDFDNRQIFCVKGCNDASNFYFQWIRLEVSSPLPPALVPDSLTSTTLSLEWFVPPKFLELAKGNLFKKTKNETYFVQCYEDLEADWKICGNQTIYENSTIHMEQLQPYTKYRFRVALLLSENEVIYSEPSVDISTNEEGIPESPPIIKHASTVDQTRIMVEWMSGLKNNGPILSYKLEIRDLTQTGYYAVKEVAASNETNYYIFEKLSAERNYSIRIASRNTRGVGPYAEEHAVTPPYSKSESSEDLKIILASENSILSQNPDFLLAQPITFYTTNSRISGIALDVRKKLIFVAEDDGCIYQSSLELTVKTDRKEVICQKNGLNMKPLLLSVDWLNDHLYIMGENAHLESWTISRCDFDGKKLIVAVGGLNGKPSNIEVDPYNGYLFWVIPDEAVDSGLYRLDLGDISNGIKHETKPFQMIKGRNLGAFVVYNTRFRLYVPMQSENTIMSVSLNGKDQEDIRKNTQSPLLHSVKSLAMANNLFIWTNGKEILTEEYHLKHNAYFHNSYPIRDSNTPMVAVHVNSTPSQPIPVPVNPPHNCQALLGSTKAKVSWQIPQLVGDQGKGAFKNWFYRLEVSGGNETETFENITGNSYAVSQLKPNSLYSFKVAAYTSGGSGAWSQEFKAKTLKTSDERYLIWASNEGLLQSDVTGENIITLLPKEELGDLIVTDITWFENLLYIVANTTLKIYNRTNGELSKLGEMDSVGGVAVDWIGRRLYWSNPAQQLINRGRLNGDQQEPLPIVANVREIKIDALRGNIYFSTWITVESYRLNGKLPKKYFTVPPYSGKKVVGLTLDLDEQNIFWIVRSYQGSSLYSAKLLDSWINDSEPDIVETKLEERSLNGPLTHFSDRLVWQQDDKTIVFGDMYGKNLAFFNNDKLTGLTCIIVIDQTHHAYPSINGSINVIPEQIPSSSIKIIGTYKFFNITWNPTANVNYGNVFYEIKIKSPKIGEINSEQTQNVYQFAANAVEPYASLEIFIRAFTFWGSSPVSKKIDHSPPGLPSEPTVPRVYTKHVSYPLRDNISISANFLWSPPNQPNGRILGYKVFCYEYKSDGERVLRENRTVTGMEQVFEGLRKDDRYTFEVLAYTSVGEGKTSESIYVETKHERPVPKVLVSTLEEIFEVDLDRHQSTMLVGTSHAVVAFTHIAHEQKLFWFDSTNHLFSYQIEERLEKQLMKTTSTVKAMTIDWIGRIIYWSQIDDNRGVIYSLNLNRVENLKSKTVPDLKVAQKVYEGPNIFSDLVISPFDRKLFWIENHKNFSDESGIYYRDLDTGVVRMLFEGSEECMNYTSATIAPIPGSLLFASSPINPSEGDSNEHQSILIFAMGLHLQFVAIQLETKQCFDMGPNAPTEGSNLVKDSNKVYWINDGRTVYAREDLTGKIISQEVPQANKILAFYQQRFPKKECLVPGVSNYAIKNKVNESTDVSLLLELPIPILPESCSVTKIPVNYTIQYTDVNPIDRSTSTEDYHSISTYEHIEAVENLKPYTNYYFRVSMTSVFDKTGQDNFVASANFMTEAGRPSQPRNLEVIPLSFNEILVSWLEPETFNSAEIKYEINWQQENTEENITKKQAKFLQPQDISRKGFTETITHKMDVLPNQSYSIFVRAYSKSSKSKSSNLYSDSDNVTVISYPEPPPLKVNSTTPTSMIIMWHQANNVTNFAIQYTKQESNELLNVTNFLYQDSLSKFFLVDNLEPKTKYNFSLLLVYVNSNRTYHWTPTKKIEFETLGDVPSSPGKPIVEHVQGTVWKVTWNASKDNGASVTEYILESKRIYNLDEFEKVRKDSRVRRSAGDSNDIRSVGDSNDIATDNNEVGQEEVTEMPNEVEDKPEEKWIERHRGPDTHWIIPDLKPIDQYIFRVSAVNSYGVSSHSPISDFLNATIKNYDAGMTNPVNSEKSTYFMLASLPISITILGLFLVCAILIIYRNRRNKKFHDGISPIPDLELATLQELHSGEHLILSRNVIYNQFYGPAITNTEIKHMPQIHLNQIIITNRCLGKGAFGEVWCGIIKNEDGSEERVAIKTLHKGANENERREFLQEAQLMSNFKHDNILRMIGICLYKNESLLYIVMELMESGDLLSYLRNNRPTGDQSSSLRLSDLVSMCVGVASGCRYLEEMHFVHRDIAARNCLVNLTEGVGRVVKIGDFGLARDIYKNDYYRKEGEGLLPVRWMSPESLIDGVFTSQSDIWAFGVLMWEVITLGQQPYQGHTNLEVLQYVRGGGRLPRPNQNCPEELYQVMAKCWNRVDQRPTFRYCLEMLQSLQELKNLYAEIEAQFPHDVPYKYVSSDSSTMNDKKNLSHNETSIELSSVTSQGTPSMPKYLELMYDENSDSRSVENMCEPPVSFCEKHQNDENNSYRNSQKLSNVKDDGYEIPISIDPTLDINANNELNNSLSKSRTLSNSSTVSNKSEHFPILPERLPEACKRSSLILERDHKIYPAKVITRQSGWV